MRRVYVLLNNLDQAKAMVKSLLVEKVGEKQLHVMAKEGTDLGDLPTASLFQKRDIRRSLLLGAGLGAVVGIIIGIVVHFEFNMAYGGLMALITLLGAIFGAWSASMIGMMVPNSTIAPFQDAIDEGKVLLMVDLEKRQLDVIKLVTKRLHITPQYEGVEPTQPSFP